MTLTRAAIALSLAALGCQRTAESQCYAVDPHSPVVWSEVEDPVRFLTDDYCGRGASQREGLERNLTAFCVPRPAEGCDPCAFDDEAVELRLRTEIEALFDEAGCAADEDPELVHGCVAEWVERDECCWAGEFFTDPDTCVLDGSGPQP